MRQAHLCVARWWYDANISFNGANSKYYQTMWDAVTGIGLGYKGPTFYELRGALLKDLVQEVECYLVDIKSCWATYGCSIMSDGWTNKKQPIINFLIHCPKGTMFLKSIDTSGLTKDANTLFEMFDEVVKVVGPQNVVQFITDNDAAYKAAGIKLMAKYDTFFWSPYAAHCIDLMLESFSKPGNFPTIDATIQKAKKITKFIYNHGRVLALMRREYTNGRDLCHRGVTRFATHFLSLKCLLMFKKEHGKMFSCDKWVDSRYAKTSVGKTVQSIVLEDREFWSTCQHVVKVSEPLVRVLHLVDGDEKPTMGYLYEAMEIAKETVKTRLKNRLSQFLPYTRVIEQRWSNQLHSPLHAAGYMLNLDIFFRPSFTKQREVTRGFMTVVTRLIPSFDVQEKISEQLELYKNSIVAWWEQFGNDCPDLQKFAVQILSQCTSATGCERNWSTFEFIHSKKRNRLEHHRLNDLVYVRYNLKLRERNIQKVRQALDPINVEHINLMEDWISEEPSLLEKDDFENDWESLDLPLDKFANLRIQDDGEVAFDEEDDVEVPINEGLWQQVLALSDDENA